MNERISRPVVGAFAVAAAAALLTGAMAALLPLKLFLIAVCCAAYFGVCIINIKYGLFLTLLIRSAADALSGYALDVPGLGPINTAAVMGVFMVLLAVMALLTGAISLRSPLTGYFLAFLAFAALPTVIFGNIGAGAEKWLKFASLAAIFLLVYSLTREDAHFGEKVVRVTIASALVPLAAGAVQFATGSGNLFTEGLNRLTGTFVHPNPFAFYLVIVIAACAIDLAHRRNAFAALVMAASLAELGLTYTRGAWIGLVLMSLVILVTLEARGKFKYVLLAAIALIPFAGMVSARFGDVLSSNMSDSSLATRFYIWGSMIETSLRSPFIGHGLGTFEFYAAQSIGWRTEAHNEYLRIFFETGAFGLAAFLSLLGAAAVRLFPRGGARRSMTAAAVFALMLTFAVMNAADNIIDNLVSQWYLWSLAAAALASAATAAVAPSASSALAGGRRPEA